MTTNAELYKRYRAVLPSYVKPLYTEPISIHRGQGSYVWDVEGNRYLDFFGGVLTTMVGHNNPAVTAAIQNQASKVLHTSTLYLCEPMIQLAEEIAAVSGIDDARVFFTTSGSEANDTAILLATSYRKSNEVLAMRNSYHGRSFTTQAITAHSSWTSTALSGLSVHFVHGAYRLRSPFRDLDDEELTAACTEDLRQVLDMMTTGSPACFIAEPIQGVGGFTTPPDGFFTPMHKLLSKHETLFVTDEVQTGWGRTGEHFWGYQAHNIIPDMLTFAKGVGNGITLAGIVARAEIMDTIKALSFSTFGGNPLSAAAGLATLRYVQENNLQQNASTMGRRMVDALRPAAQRAPWIAELRGKGLMWALEIVVPDTIEPDAVRAGDLLEGCKRRGLLVGKGGLYGNVLRITPMLDVTAAEIDEGVAAICETIEEIEEIDRKV